MIVASRSLDDLAAPVRAAALAMLAKCQTAGIDLLIYCTLRSNAEQAQLYAQGRTKPGVVVTNAKPGQSMHNPDTNGQAWAFDAVPLVSGKAAWDDVAMVDKMGTIGEACGLEWAGRWRGPLRERVHFQMPRGAAV